MCGCGAASIVHFAFADAAFHLDPICLAQTRGGAKHARGQRAVAGEQNEAACGVIEAPDWKNALGRTAEKIAQCLAAFGIGHGRNHLRRFVQHDVDLLVGNFGHAARDFDAIVFGIGLRAELSDDLAIHAHLAAANQFFGVAA
jgi:hypothetical protein